MLRKRIGFEVLSVVWLFKFYKNNPPGGMRLQDGGYPPRGLVR
jgi:hypothetical protein